MRDIVNRDIVNLINCDQEPIHIPGSIQPHGFLIAISTDGTIEFCSGNLSDFIPLQKEDLLGKHASILEGLDLAKTLSAGNAPAHWRNRIAGANFWVTAHRIHDLVILEAEPDRTSETDEDAYSQTLKFLSFLNQTSTLKELCDHIAHSTRNLTGYDRVMIYRFDSEYNGEVFAESVRDDLEPFLGLHYPHTDIPVQARELYLRNLLRIIPDIYYTPVPIYTLDTTGKNLDMSLSTLRSTSPIHVEYLSNMGVGATLTVSLIHRGRLWGLIACHHYSAKNIPTDVRAAAQLQGQFITSQIDIRQSNEQYEVSRDCNIALEKLSAIDLPALENPFEVLLEQPAVLEICNATGVAIINHGNVFSSGLSLSDDVCLKLADLMQKNGFTNFHTDKVTSLAPELANLCGVVAGFLFHSMGNASAIMWFRPEHVTEVHWGGDPNKAIIRDENGLHPRNSFEKWQEVVKCKSRPWMQPELNAAANWAHALQHQLSMIRIQTEEEKYRNLSEVLRETNAELENINWISTHDLQEPLRKIQLQTSRLMDRETDAMPENTARALSGISRSAERMQTLLSDILRYTRVRHTDASFVKVSLDELLEDVLSESAETIRESAATVVKSPLPEVAGIPFLLRQLFLNLIQNAIKYQHPERSLILEITTANLGDQGVRIDFKDNGSGFESKYAESIFNIFTRLHNGENYAGSGVGLALCKKIMQTHNGRITATGEPNEGAIFSLFFPS